MFQKKLIAASLSVILAVAVGGIGYSYFHTPSVNFNEEIRPILNNKCMRCHGGVKRSGGLSLLFRSEALAENESGLPAIIPGDVAGSEMIKRIRHTDPELRMPLDGEPLNEEEIALLEKWIENGAEWEQHWAYAPPEKPEIPPVKRFSWTTNPIDHFVVAKQEKRGLVPANQSDKAILLRRLSLDLTGLPPTWEEVVAFEADESENAYEKRLDQLLESPRFGEKWASMWLDLARYADSKGYEKDPHRTISQYRDWVIQAFNENMPFDQFTIEQLAGDLLPAPEREQLIATAFHRNTMNNTEGGTEDEEYRVAAVLDRINTTWTVWQGTTMECVQCHSHPYDPFLQKDYYRSYAFFNQTKDADLTHEFPVLVQYPPQLDSAIRSVISKIRTYPAYQHISQHAPLTSQIQDALYPTLIPGDCDDFNDVTINGNRSITNWTTNPNNISDKEFMFMFEDIDLANVTHISYQYTSIGSEGTLELVLDHPNGEQLHHINFTKAKDGIRKVALNGVSGVHDLYFLMDNRLVNEPEGKYTLKEIRLLQEGSYPDPILMAYQDSLKYYYLETHAPEIPIMRERTEENLRQTREFIRGNWMVPGDTVHSNVPGSLPGMSSDYSRDRLGFAQWLVSQDNPLTSRVIVNRFWSEIFGRGIVETTEDFGTQGIPPTHPELLDWLAVHFQQDLQWDMKALLKLIVMSSTYRQSAVAEPNMIARDPENKWLTRGARIRLTSEQVRDQALAVSGLLSDKMYGPPVMPPQPDNVWQVVYSGMQWKESKGEDRYRRAIYTYFRRTSPYPSMTTFDSPSREFCVSRRIRTNTPLQALITLNDTVYVEAAAALARRMIKAGASLQDQITVGYQMALMQTPDAETLSILENLYHEARKDTDISMKGQQHIHFVSDRSKANKHHDALSIVASAIMNLDSFIMKE